MMYFIWKQVCFWREFSLYTWYILFPLSYWKFGLTTDLLTGDYPYFVKTPQVLHSGQLACMDNSPMRQRLRGSVPVCSSVPQIISQLALKFKVGGNDMSAGYSKFFILETLL